MRFLILVLSLLAATSVHAKERAGDRGEDKIPRSKREIRNLEDAWRQGAITVFRNAIENGRTEIDGISIAQLEEAAKTTLFIFDPRLTISMGHRKCAGWFAEMKGATEIPSGRKVDVPAHVRISKACANLPAHYIGPMAAHEVAGVTLNQDLEYEFILKVLGYDSEDKETNIFNPTKVAPLESTLSSQHRIVTGGGGDLDDLVFRINCHKTLNELALVRGHYWGIPYEFMKVAIRKMRVRPAADIETLVMLRGRNLENLGQPAVYIKSHVYRGQDNLAKGVACLSAARLHVLYIPEVLGLTKNMDSLVSFDEKYARPQIFYASEILKVETLWMPRGGEVIFWSQPRELRQTSTGESNPSDADKLIEVSRMIADPAYRHSAIHDYEVQLRVGTEIETFRAAWPTKP